MITQEEIEKIEQLWPHLKEVNHNGVYWRDIDWDLPIHCPMYCDYCGADGAEGHLAKCGYCSVIRRHQQEDNSSKTA